MITSYGLIYLGIWISLKYISLPCEPWGLATKKRPLLIKRKELLTRRIHEPK